MKQIGLFDHLVVVSSFTCGKVNLIKALRNLKRTHRISSRDMFYTKIELFSIEGKVVLRFYENEQVLISEPVGFCRAEFYLKDALEALLADRSKEVIVNVTHKTIGFNEVTLAADVKKLDTKDKEIPLSILKEKVKEVDPYAPDKDKFFFTRDMTRGFHYQDVCQDIEAVKAVLSKYKIKPEEINKFVYLFLRSRHDGFR
jgi:hypothetical protein